MKTSVSKEKFAIKYLCKNEKAHETIFACSFWAQVKSFKQKKMVENHCHFLLQISSGNLFMLLLQNIPRNLLEGLFTN